MPNDTAQIEIPKVVIRLSEWRRGFCSNTTAHRWIKEGKLPVIKLGRSTWCTVSREEFIARNAQRSPEPA